MRRLATEPCAVPSKQAAPAEEPATARAPGALLCHRADRRALGFVAGTLALLITPLLWPPPTALIAPWVAVATLACFSACIVNHNHVHRALFRRRALNRALELALSVAKGHSSNGVRVAHNLNHHRYNGGPQDWIRTSLAGGGLGVWRLVRYVACASLSMARGRSAADAPRLSPRLRSAVAHERLAIAAFIALALAWAGAQAVLYVGLPWLLAMAALVGVNLLQHDGCVPQSRYQQARNFTGRLGNWLFFNNGYHTAHHLHPEAHWSELPALHAGEVRPHLHPALEQRSILAFLARAYLLAGRARREQLICVVARHGAANRNTGSWAIE